VKNLVVLLTFFGALAFIYFAFPQVQQLIYYAPCDHPIRYKIGTIDDRFKISQADLKTDLTQAAQVWDKPEGKELFVFDPQAVLTVNMIYDQRQYLSSQLDQLGNTVHNLNTTVGSMETNLNTQQKNLNQEIAQFQSDVNDFKSELDQYNKDVQYWNSRGGAPPDEYQKLQQTQQDLQNKQQQLNATQAKIQAETKNYNGSVDTLNQSIGDLNSQIGTLKQTANNFNQTIEQHPEEGLYDGPDQTIDIYYNISHAELVHTLAHEMGHALGMDHNQNKNSIMYPYTTQILTPSADDLTSLAQVCQKLL